MMGGEGWLVCAAGPFVVVAGVMACILRRLVLDLQDPRDGTVYLKTRLVGSAADRR